MSTHDCACLLLQQHPGVPRNPSVMYPLYVLLTSAGARSCLVPARSADFRTQVYKA